MATSQEMPPIINYSPKDYKGGNQNWMVAQDKNHFLYFANNDGLLEFNGANYTLHPLPNRTIVRSVKCIDNFIFTGSYMSFGYWTRQNNGDLTYTDLSKNIKDKMLDDEQFWGIEHYNQWILFQSLDQIYVYDTKTSKISVIKPTNNIYKLFKTSTGLFFHGKDGLFEIENNQPKLVFNTIVLTNDKIINIEEFDKTTIVFTQHNGLFTLENNQLKPFKTDADKLIKDGEIYSVKKIKNHLFAIGTISQGLIIIDANGQIVHHINQNNGLRNNTVLSILEDADYNLWLGLDNGINCINYDSPIRSNIDESGIIGTVYAAKLFNGKLYIGSNQGLFYKNYPSPEDFKFVSGTKGQVWSLFVHDNTLFCAHDMGTFVIKDTQSKQIFNQSGTWKFEIFKDKILQGNYNGFSILEKINGQWSFIKFLDGFNFSAKHFELSGTKDIIVNHEYKGVFKLELDDKNEKITSFKLLNAPQKGKNSGLAKFNQTVYYAYEKGVYQYKNKSFKKDEHLSDIFKNDDYITGRMIVENGKLWFFTKNYIQYFTLGKLSQQYINHSLSIPAEVTNSMPGYENLCYLGNNEYLIGTTNGYYVINPQELKLSLNKIYLSKVEVLKADQSNFSLDFSGENFLKSSHNHINFQLAMPFYNNYLSAEYQYFLEGYDKNWSIWQTQAKINYSNLPPGKYTFYAKGKISNQITDTPIQFSFEILEPWFKNGWAKLIYILLFALFAFYTHKGYNYYHNQKHQQIISENNLLLELKELENQKEIMKFQNEKLSEDVEKKDKELAISNLNLVQKTELLKIIKEDLKNTEDINEKGKIKRIISTINKDTKEEDTWHVFKEAFDKADHDFLKKMKQMHPSLTPNDLRLCAYLRINLNSKEIAPLLNISLRSVEIKRYRLRKKMNLTHEQGLTEYILGV